MIAGLHGHWNGRGEAGPRPVLYLDVDGVLWDIDREAYDRGEEWYKKGANGLREFLDLAFAEFEVRWITTWAPRGSMSMREREWLAKHTGISAGEWAKVRDSNGWDGKHKHLHIDEPEHLAGRPFVWVEDELLDSEKAWLKERGWWDRYFFTDVFDDPDALVKTTVALREWLTEREALEGTD